MSLVPNVQLTPKMKRFIADAVASGRYETGSEVVRAGMRLLMEESERQEQVRARVAKKRRPRRRAPGEDDSPFDAGARGGRADG